MNRNLQTCAWSKDGKSLASAVEDSLCIFSWTDLTKPNNFTFAHWNSLEVTGKINCIASWKTSSFIIVTELPLDKLCGYCKFENDTDVFEVQNGSDSSDRVKERNLILLKFLHRILLERLSLTLRGRTSNGKRQK